MTTTAKPLGPNYVTLTIGELIGELKEHKNRRVVRQMNHSLTKNVLEHRNAKRHQAVLLVPCHVAQRIKMA